MHKKENTCAGKDLLEGLSTLIEKKSVKNFAILSYITIRVKCYGTIFMLYISNLLQKCHVERSETSYQDPSALLQDDK